MYNYGSDFFDNQRSTNMRKMKDFDNFGLMLAVSYKSSLSMKTLKRFFETVASMGYKSIGLCNK